MSCDSQSPFSDAQPAEKEDIPLHATKRIPASSRLRANGPDCLPRITRAPTMITTKLKYAVLLEVWIKLALTAACESCPLFPPTSAWKAGCDASAKEARKWNIKAAECGKLAAAASVVQRVSPEEKRPGESEHG